MFPSQCYNVSTTSVQDGRKGWMHGLADFIAPTEMGGCLIMLVAHVKAYVKRNVI